MPPMFLLMMTIREWPTFLLEKESRRRTCLSTSTLIGSGGDVGYAHLLARENNMPIGFVQFTSMLRQMHQSTTTRIWKTTLISLSSFAERDGMMRSRTFACFAMMVQTKTD